MDPVDLLKDLVAIPSVNPMGRDLTGPEFFEKRVSDYLEGLFRQLGVRYQRIEVASGRANVIARAGGDCAPIPARPVTRSAPQTAGRFSIWEGSQYSRANA